MLEKYRSCLLLVTLVLAPLAGHAQGVDTSKVDAALGRAGQKIGDTYRVAFPRSDLHVTVNGISIKAGFALGSWATFSGSDSDAHVMGDLVLLQTEVPLVMGKLRDSGFEITALHNHLLNETPRVMYMHYLGHGAATDLAKSLRAALALSKTPLAAPATSAAPSTEAPQFVKTINDIIGSQGKWSGGVLSFGIARTDAITENGITLTGAQGVAESINFQDAGTGRVATTGDFVLTAAEINAVISALDEHHISVTALHSHMLTEEPRLFFMHFWGMGGAESIAQGIKAALSHVAVR
jgi:hypothetical protein